LLHYLDINTLNKMTTFTNKIITQKEYKNGLESEVGTLMFGGDYYDMFSYMDEKEIKAKLNLRKDQKIKAIVVMTKGCPGFKNIANTDLPLKYGVFCEKDADGAYLGDFLNMYQYKHPIGDAFIVVNKL